MAMTKYRVRDTIDGYQIGEHDGVDMYLAADVEAWLEAHFNQPDYCMIVSVKRLLDELRGNAPYPC